GALSQPSFEVDGESPSKLACPESIEAVPLGWLSAIDSVCPNRDGRTPAKLAVAALTNEPMRRLRTRQHPSRAGQYQGKLIRGPGACGRDTSEHRTPWRDGRPP